MTGARAWAAVGALAALIASAALGARGRAAAIDAACAVFLLALWLARERDDDGPHP